MIVWAFFMSSGNPFQARVTDGRKELKYCCDFAVRLVAQGIPCGTTNSRGGGQARRDILVSFHVASDNKV